MLFAIYELIIRLIQIYTYIVIIAVVFSMLFAFGIIDSRNRVVYEIGVFLNRVTEPVLAPIRNILPTIGNLDLSPMVLLLLLQYVVVPGIGLIFGMLIQSTAG